MRYDEIRRFGGRGSFWLRLRLALARIRGSRPPQPPVTPMLRLNDHLLRDIGVAPPRCPASWQDFR